jgi:hypothetical protein
VYTYCMPLVLFYNTNAQMHIATDLHTGRSRQFKDAISTCACASASSAAHAAAACFVSSCCFAASSICGSAVKPLVTLLRADDNQPNCIQQQMDSANGCRQLSMEQPNQIWHRERLPIADSRRLLTTEPSPEALVASVLVDVHALELPVHQLVAAASAQAMSLMNELLYRFEVTPAYYKHIFNAVRYIVFTSVRILLSAKISNSRLNAGERSNCTQSISSLLFGYAFAALQRHPDSVLQQIRVLIAAFWPGQCHLGQLVMLPAAQLFAPEHSQTQHPAMA